MDKRNNRVINEIMSNSSSSIFVISSSDCEYTSFLSELSNRYPTTYWFNGKYDNSFSFSLEIARKVLDENETYLRMMQLKYTENDKVDNIIVKVVLEDIRKKQGDCLFVFDHLEELPEDFDFSLIELLIKNCPKNLKLIFISEKLININFNKLEELTPKIVDEFALGNDNKLKEIELDIKDLSETDINFLAYISQLEEAPMELVNSIYNKGAGVLRYASIRYKHLVVNKNNYCFKISRTFHKYLIEKAKQFGTNSSFTKDINDILYEYLTSKGKHLNALKLGINIDNLSYIESSLKVIIDDWGLVYRLFEMARYKSNAIQEKYVTLNNPECYAYSALCDYWEQNYEEAIEKIDKVLALNDLPQEAWKKCCYYKLKFLSDIGEYAKGIEFASSVMPSNYEQEKTEKFDCILCSLPQLLHYTEQSIDLQKLKHCEKLIATNNYSNSYLYVKVLQSISEAFFDLGNYRKAIALVQKIKALVPFYVVPHRLLQYFYYMNDPIYAEKIALSALQKAKDYSITTDVASIYCLLYKIYAFWNMKNEALENIELAINSEDSCDFIKYHTIALRTICYARFSKKEHVKDIAIIYGKQCEQDNLKYANVIYGSISYWYWYNHRKDEALFFANKCLKGSSRNGMWLIASGVAITYAIDEESNPDIKQIISKFFYTAEQYAMDMVLIDYDNLFSFIIKYAIEHNLSTPYIEKISNLIKNKAQKADSAIKVKVQAMGAVSVFVNGVEIEWKTKKARELFMIYVLKGTQGIDRAKIFSLLWGEYIYESAINNLKTTNNIIRNTLSHYNIEYSLDYKNGKYVLTLANCEFDYVKYLKYIDRFNFENVLSEKINLMLDIIDIYGAGFAPELNNADFKEIRQNLKHNICIMLVEFIKLLKESGRLIDANKFQNSLARIDDGGKYLDMVIRLDERKHI